MRIAWVCFYPASEFRSRPSLKDCRPAFHPVPWITVQAPLLAAMPGLELHVVTVGRDYSADDHFQHNGIHFHFLRVPAVPRALLWFQLDRRRIHNCLKAIAPDIVQGFGTEGSFAYAAVTSGFPAVIRMQGIMGRIVPALGFKCLLRNPGWIVPMVLERTSVRRGRHFICTTAFAADFVRELNPSAIIHRIKTPARPELFSAQRVAAPAGQPELLFLGSVLPAKGIEVLIPAFAAATREYPQAKLHVVGAYDGAYMRSVLAPLVLSLGLNQRVVFHGFQDSAAVEGFLSRASMLVLPTLMDTSPNVIPEAQIVGVPVIATNVGGVPEMIEHGRTGVLVPPGSVNALTAAILETLRDPEAALTRTRAARADAVREYDPKTQVMKLAEVYRSMLVKGTAS